MQGSAGYPRGIQRSPPARPPPGTEAGPPTWLSPLPRLSPLTLTVTLTQGRTFYETVSAPPSRASRFAVARCTRWSWNPWCPSASGQLNVPAQNTQAPLAAW